MPKAAPKSKKQPKQAQQQDDDSDVEEIPADEANKSNGELTNVFITNMDFCLSGLIKDVVAGYDSIELKYSRLVSEFMSDFDKRSRSASIVSADECISNSPTPPPSSEMNKVAKKNKTSPSNV